MVISKTRTIAAIQEEFNGKFPHLKIEFYKHKHGVGEGSEAADQIDTSKSISDISSIDSDAEISIHGNLKTASLEQEFETQFGIHVQVFRKAGKIWLQTTNTDEWTLAEQEEKGLEYEAH